MNSEANNETTSRYSCAIGPIGWNKLANRLDWAEPHGFFPMDRMNKAGIGQPYSGRDRHIRTVGATCTKPQLQEPIKDPARFDWREVTKVAHYHMSVDAMTRPTQLREDSLP